ncbi:hypothetical protein LIER_07040 [Lithospermum erythrorhizon]|uniref:Molybdenum cofactor sulfurase n=1 Tax=Lithospermum erythrorhizon TaxID=34254 RepID=A0AAV3PAI8_LITER
MSCDMEKEEFLKEFGDDYGYPNAPNKIDEIRATQFKRLDGLVYLDHAGATLYSESQMEAIFKDLNSNVFGNPHSQSNSSLATTDCIEEARQQVLNFFNASPREYYCVFTSGATAAFKLVGEAFPFSKGSRFMYTMENHNSVLGIREYALDKGAGAFAVDIEGADTASKQGHPKSTIKFLQHQTQKRSEAHLSEEADPFNLFAFPSECNFSGLRFNLDLVKIIKEESDALLKGSQSDRGRWMVLIDAAKGCATNPPDLSKYKADFVVISFYKIFGYPTGLGALLVRNEAASVMRKTYFGGGTVAASIADIDFVKRREGFQEFFEDGTASFLNIAAIRHGFNILHSLTMPAISRHSASLATYVRNRLLALRHGNGRSICTIYALNYSKEIYSSGPTVTFNLKRSDGSWFGHREVEKLASLSGIQLRTGCFCNPGACAKYLGLTHSDLLSNVEAGHVCWDDHDVLNGKPTGAVRVSFGYMSTFEDARRFINFIEYDFLLLRSESAHFNPLILRRTPPPAEVNDRASLRCSLKSITVYPVKSCAGFNADSWPLSSTGLLHDREWLLKSMNGEVLTQKKVPEMCYITTLIDLDLRALFVESPRCKEKLKIDLNSDVSLTRRDELGIYSRRYEVETSSDEVDSWFSKAVGRPCTLLRTSGSLAFAGSNGNKNSGMCGDWDAQLNFVNEAQLLLVSEESVADLNRRLNSNMRNAHNGESVQVNTMRFRPNLVISGGTPYAEDGWNALRIGQKYFKSLGGCNRCQMINLIPQAGHVQRLNEPLATLAAYRRIQGKILFGILLRYEVSDDAESDPWLHVGQEILVDEDRV